MIESLSNTGLMFRFRRASLLAALAGAAFLVSAGSVRADVSGGKVYTVTVSYADLDISRRAGAEVLYQRIRSAARQACGRADWQWPVAYYTWQQCVRSAVSGALESLYEAEPGTARLERVT